MWGVSTEKYTEYKKSRRQWQRASLQPKPPEYTYSHANETPTNNSILSDVQENVKKDIPPIENMVAEQMSRGGKPAAESARERFFDFSRKLYTETVDNLHPLARLDEKVKILSSNMRKSKGTADSILHNGMVDMAG